MVKLNEQYNDEGFNNWKRKERRAQITFGILVIAAGLVYLLYQMDYAIPDWVFRWPTILLGISLITAVKHGLNNFKWVGFFAIGLLFMIGYAYPDSVIMMYKIPIVLFIIGAIIILKPKNKKQQYSKYQMKHSRYCPPLMSESITKDNEDYIFVNNIFAGSEKLVFSKDFKGGDIKNTFGGCEINLMQADIVEEAVIHVNQQFAGTKLIIPPHWIIKSDVNCVFAGIEDKRPVVPIDKQSETKTLVLRGNIFMAGLEIVSY